MLKILGKSSSINVRKVLWTCSEIGLDYDQDAWGAGTAQPCDAPEFLARNPHGQVPVIEDDGAVLWESNTICRYLASRHGRTDLLPAAPMERAQVEKWMDWQVSDLNNAWRYAFMGLVRGSPAHADKAAIAASVFSWNRQMAILDGQLARTGAYAAGAVFTLADVVLGLSVHRWMAAPLDHPPLPAVQAYYALLSQREGFLLHGRNGMP